MNDRAFVYGEVEEDKAEAGPVAGVGIVGLVFNGRYHRQQHCADKQQHRGKPGGNRLLGIDAKQVQKRDQQAVVGVGQYILYQILGDQTLQSQIESDDP